MCPSGGRRSADARVPACSRPLHMILPNLQDGCNTGAGATGEMVQRINRPGPMLLTRVDRPRRGIAEGHVVVASGSVFLSHGDAVRNRAARSLPSLPMLATRSRRLRIASGEGFVLPFSHRLIVGSVTPSFAANFSCVSPRRARTSRINAAGSLPWANSVPPGRQPINHMLNQMINCGPARMPCQRRSFGDVRPD